MKISTSLTTIAIFLICPTLKAQSKFQTKSVSVFKNGSAFFLKEANVKTNNNSYFLSNESPKAAFGTLWFSSTTGKIKQVQTHTKTTTKIKERKSSFKSSNFQSMLLANLNKTVTIYPLNEKAITGKIEKVNGDYFILNGDNRWVNMKIDRIDRIEFNEKPIYPDSTSIIKDTIIDKTQGLLIDFQSKKSDQQLEMMYLEKGISWSPTYHIDLINETSALLKLQAEVINNAEDILNSDINFVIGVPNFIHENQLSPLTESLKFDHFLNGLQNTRKSANSDFANRGNNRIAYSIDQESNSSQQANTSSIEGSSTEDLFFYSLNNVKLKKGDRAFYNIMETKLPVKHIYEVRLNKSKVDHYYNNSNKSNAFSFEENFKNKVWHTLKITNNTSTPLTSGSVLVTKTHKNQTRPISQDKITYTSPSGHAFLKLTVAPDVSVKEAEKVTARQGKVKKINGYDYDLVTIDGEIRVRNYKNKAIDLNIRRKITGELKTSDPIWLKAPNIPTHRDVNETTDLCWETKLKQGEKKVIKYQYSILVRSR